MLAARLSEQLPLGEARVLAHNYLGVAYLWSKTYDKAEVQFELALQTAAACTPPTSPLLPRANQLVLELLKALFERYRTGNVPSLESFRRRMAQFEHDFQIEAGSPIVPGYALYFFTMVRLVRSGLQCPAGNTQLAQAGLDGCRHKMVKAGSESLTWLHAMGWLVSAEIARSQRDWQHAESDVAQMIDVAILVEHEQLTDIGDLCEGDIFATQGKHERALHSQLQLRQREQLIRAEQVESRARVVEWQLGIRQGERELHGAEAASKRFEALALQDALTGIANRRCLDLRLAENLHRSVLTSQPLCVALIDVDQFKSVNDGHGHAVGDAVLQRVADVLVKHVRATDLPARMAGDEFAVVFDRTDLAVTTGTCERIRSAVAALDWASQAPNLGVSISVGVAQAQTGDTAASLLHRSDIAMCAAKNVVRQS